MAIVLWTGGRGLGVLSRHRSRPGTTSAILHWIHHCTLDITINYHCQGVNVHFNFENKSYCPRKKDKRSVYMCQARVRYPSPDPRTNKKDKALSIQTSDQLTLFVLLFLFSIPTSDP